jgi:hypothetical protein
MDKVSKTSIVSGALVASLLTSCSIAQAALVEKKQVRLTCSSLPYVFDCSIPIVTNTQFGSRCFYVAGGQSTFMRADHRMGFSNQIVSLQVDAGMTVTGVVTEKLTGNQSECAQEEN